MECRVGRDRLLCGLNSSQLDHRLTARFFGRHTQSTIVFDVHLDVALDLFFEFPVLALLVEQAAQSHNPSAKSSHSWQTIRPETAVILLERL